MFLHQGNQVVLTCSSAGGKSGLWDRALRRSDGAQFKMKNRTLIFFHFLQKSISALFLFLQKKWKYSCIDVTIRDLNNKLSSCHRPKK